MCPADPPLFAVHRQKKEAAAVRGSHPAGCLSVSDCFSAVRRAIETIEMCKL